MRENMIGSRPTQGLVALCPLVLRHIWSWTEVALAAMLPRTCAPKNVLKVRELIL